MEVPGDNLLRRDGAVLGGAERGRLHQGYRQEVVAAREGRRGCGLERDQELAHGAGKGVGKPAFGPRRPVELRIPPSREADGGRRRVGIVAPSNVADGQAVEPLYSPRDADVTGATLPGRPGPDVVDDDAP